MSQKFFQKGGERMRVKRNWEESPPRCGFCGRELAAEEPYWLIGGSRLCPDCLPDFARAEYRSCLRLPGRKEGTE